MKQVIVRTFLCFLQLSLVSSFCRDYNNCVQCTSHRSWTIVAKCRWCPLDKKCHAYGSLTTSCKSDMNIKESSRCYVESYGIFSPDNAFVSTLLSAAAYSRDPEQCLEDIYPDGEYDLVEVIGCRCDDFLFDYGECFAYTAISHTTKVIVLAYRGTTSTKQLIDQILTILTIPKQPFVTGGKVQKYFKNAHDKLYHCTKNSISDLVSKYPNYDVTIVGHSLGGALASLASARLVKDNVVSQNRMSLYTFGMPRVGNKAYAFEHDKLVNNSWRLVHYRDIVSHLPTCNLVTGCSVTNGPFHHRKEIYYNSKTMDVTSYFRECNGNEDSRCSNREMTIHPCTFDIKTCIKYHKTYFGIEVGEYCKRDVAGYTFGLSRPSSVSNMSHETFHSKDVCQRQRVKSGSHSDTSPYLGIPDTVWVVIGVMFSVVITLACLCYPFYKCYKCYKDISGS